VSSNQDRRISLLVRNTLFTLVVPGIGGVLVPIWLLRRSGADSTPEVWPAVAVIAAGAGLYLACVWRFAGEGGGTPGPWDAPRRVVAAGPYRWVRNPIYISALLVVLGEAWLFLSSSVLVYAIGMALFFHLFVVGYEEPRLRRAFGETYLEYLRAVPRWIPRPPRQG